MKKFFGFIIFTIVLLAAFILPAIFLDPYNVFHPFNPRVNGIEPNSSYIKMRVVLENPDEYDCILFGSSLVGTLDTKRIEGLTGYKTYNMTRSGGLPTEYVNNIQTFVDNGVLPKLILIGIDGGSYLDSIENRLTDGLRCPYEYSVTNPYDFWKIYLNPNVWMKSLKIINNAKKSEKETATYNLLNVDDTFKEAKESVEENQLQDKAAIQREILNSGYEDGLYAYMDDCLNAIARIKSICQDNGIEVIFFTIPENCHRFQDRVITSHYLYFLQRLTEITSFYSYTGLNDYSLNDDLYYDGTHYYSTPIADALLDSMLGGKNEESLLSQGFGVTVNTDNYNDFIALLLGTEKGN